MSNTLTIENLNKTYANGVKALDNVTLELGSGMFGLAETTHAEIAQILHI